MDQFSMQAAYQALVAQANADARKAGVKGTTDAYLVGVFGQALVWIATGSNLDADPMVNRLRKTIAAAREQAAMPEHQGSAA